MPSTALEEDESACLLASRMFLGVKLCEFDKYEWSEKVFALGLFDVLIHEVVLDSFCIDAAASSKLSCVAFAHCPVCTHDSNDMSLYHFVYVDKLGSSEKISVVTVGYPSTPRCNRCIRLARCNGGGSPLVDLYVGLESFDRIY